jgi:hypothetical protein
MVTFETYWRFPLGGANRAHCAYPRRGPHRSRRHKVHAPDSTKTDKGVTFSGTAVPQALVERRAYYTRLFFLDRLQNTPG